MADRRQVRSRRTEPYYIDGNTARKLNTQRKRKSRSRQVPEFDVYTNPTQQKQKVKYEKRVSAFSLRYTLFLCVSFGILLTSCFTYMSTYSEYKTVSAEVSSLETKLATIEDQNDALEASLNEPVDLQEVYRQATQELGMVYADESQYVYYDSTNNDYVHQYESIPGK